MSQHLDPLHNQLADLERSVPTGLPPPLPTTDRQPLWLLAGATGIAAVLLAVVVVTRPDDRGVGDPSLDPIPTQSATQEPSSRLSPSASPIAVPSSTSIPQPTATPALTDREVLLSAGAPNTIQFVQDLAGGSDQFIAIVDALQSGFITATGPVDYGAALYTGTLDGGWRLVDTGDQFADAYLKYLFEPTNGPQVLYGSVGWPDSTEAAVWTSVDGATWTRVDVEVPGGVVTEGRLGYVAVDGPNETNGPRVLDIYYSSNALDWELVHSETVDYDIKINSVAGGLEGFVVTGVRDDPEAYTPFSLASADGRTWFESPPQASLTPRDHLWSVAPIGPDWVAAGWDFAGGVEPQAINGITLWWSADGLNWERTGTLPVPEGIEPHGEITSYPSALVEAGGRLFLSEALAAEGVISRPISVWTSGDGRLWEELNLGTEAEVLTVHGVQGWFLLGGRLGSEGGDGTVWRWDAPSGQ